MIYPKIVANIMGWLFFFSLVHSGVAEPEGLRRFNEAQNLDLKIRQQQTHRETSSDRQQLEKRFDRQRSQQQNLQSRQLRQIPKLGSPSTTVKSKNSLGRSSTERFKREQESQELGFKLEPTQPVGESVSSKRGSSPPFQQFFEDN